MNLIIQQNNLIQEAKNHLSIIQKDLHDISQSITNLEKESETDDLNTLQLILQYRLDTQDALKHLFLFSQSLWQVLGLSASNSQQTNIERLKFALGGEDLQYTLSLLNKLIESLLKALKRYNLSQTFPQKELIKNETKKTSLFVPPNTLSHRFQKMIRVIDNQKSFIFILNQLTNSLEAVEAAPVTGPLYDHICKLEGPISFFYQALQNGLILSGGIYQQLETNVKLNNKLSHLIANANLLVNTPVLYRPLIKQEPSLQELEERAAQKRFRPFFGMQPHP